MRSALDVAKWFLWRNDGENSDSEEVELITNLKMQKLLYYAQGCYLALYKEKLFGEKILAWDHGPVVKEVYDEYKLLDDNTPRGHNGIKYNNDFQKNFTDEEETALNFVFKEFGKYSAWMLRNMTHAEDPWKNTEHNEEISTEIIEEYFTKEYLIDE